MVLPGCEKPVEKQSEFINGPVPFREIPGITHDEIQAIEYLQESRRSFVYGMNPSTEAFIGRAGEVQGYAVLFCDWLTSIFGIPFKPAHYEWDDLLKGLESGEIDFTGELMATPERRKIYFMTSPIAQRSLDIYRLYNSKPLEGIMEQRLLRYAFLENSITLADVTANAGHDFETILLDSYEAAYRMLKSGQIDAFIAENTAEGFFDAYGDVEGNRFLPLIYKSACLSTRQMELLPVISVVQKALEYGSIKYLTGLYNAGYHEYYRNKLFAGFTAEEIEYIGSAPAVRFAAENSNYPTSFYNENEKEWQGIVFDVLKEVEALTGLTFEIVNDSSGNTNWSELLGMLEDGRASMISELLPTDRLAGRFLWPNTSFLTDNYALMSKSELPNIEIHDILSLKVGYGANELSFGMFKKWFPNHMETVEYDSIMAAYDALIAGEVDLVIASVTSLLVQTNYMERAGLKANYVFDQTYDSTFGFNINETALCSVIDKSLKFIDTKGISDQWLRRTFDYRAKVAEAQRPWFISVSLLFFIILVLVSIFLVLSKNTGKRLEKIVKERTNDLERETAMLKIMEEKALAASQAKSAFLANMSHELRTPLNVVIGLTDLVLEEGSLSGNVTKNLIKINDAGSTLLSIVNDILDFSKIESGKFELTPVEYYMSSLLNDVITLVHTRIAEKPITFNLVISENLPNRLYGDDLRIKQILNNLLSNAIKYTQRGIIELSVQCKRDGTGYLMEIAVKDSGMGIREEHLKMLFTDYYQADTRANRKIEGTGLGLSITRQLAEMMEGEISAESEYGKGSTFHVKIRQGFIDDMPIGPNIADNLRNYNYAEDKRIVTKKLVRSNLSYARVLVVDDMPTNLDVTAGLLHKYKMQVDCVSSGQEAIDRISKGTPVYNAIFMDHMMPDMDGIEAADKIRALGTEYAKKIPIIALTANAIQGTENIFYLHDFQAFISKPIDIMEMDSVIRKWLRNESKENLMSDDASELDTSSIDENVVIDIAGVDTAKGLSLLGNDLNLYLPFLRSYAVKTPVTLERLRNVTEETLPDYYIAVHGLKGTSASIGAESVRVKAAALEKLADKKDLQGVLLGNGELLKDAENIAANIREWLEKYDAVNQKPSQDAPGREVLLSLLASCRNYDMKGIDKAISELERTSYKQGGDLIAWIKEKLIVSEIDEIALRLAEYEGETEK